MTASVDYLPIWKKGATAAERLRELALLAEKHPELFEKWVLIYCADNDEIFKINWMRGTETRTSDCFAVLTAGIQTIYDETKR